MIAWLAAVTAAAAAVSAARPAAPGRVRSLGATATPTNGGDVLASLGHVARRRCDPLAGPAAPTDRSIGVALLVALVLLPLAPYVLAGLVGWLVLTPRLRRIRAQRRAAADVAASLPDVLDLLRLATDGGLPLTAALSAVARRTRGALPDAINAAHRQVDAGRGRADALLDALTPLGETSAALAHALADHLRYGAPLGPALDRLTIEARLARRHAAEQAARRVPVRLLLPLVLCVLPAFGLLTVVPLLAGSFRSLGG